MKNLDTVLPRPLLSVKALHHLHTFIFVLAIVHVTSCVLTIVFGGLRIRSWKKWEKSIANETQASVQPALEPVTQVHQHALIKNHFTGLGKNYAILGWLTHCKRNPKFNFHKYMMRALEDDFKKVVGISWYLGIFVVFFMLININGWHTYFWIALISVMFLLAVGTKLEHVIFQYALDVAGKHTAIQPSDDRFWFGRPRIVLFLIHWIIFQNSFEIAFFFWILLVTYGFHSCMGQARYIIPRLIIGVFIQILCSYSTLPLYALVTQMGTHYKRAIFDEQVQAKLVGRAQKAKKKGLRGESQSGQGSSHGGSSTGIQIGSIPAPENNTNVPRDEESV